MNHSSSTACSFFAQGACTRLNCPFRHVGMNRSAQFSQIGTPSSNNTDVTDSIPTIQRKSSNMTLTNNSSSKGTTLPKVQQPATKQITSSASQFAMSKNLTFTRLGSEAQLSDLKPSSHPSASTSNFPTITEIPNTSAPKTLNANTPAPTSSAPTNVLNVSNPLNPKPPNNPLKLKTSSNYSSYNMTLNSQNSTTTTKSSLSLHRNPSLPIRAHNLTLQNTSRAQSVTNFGERAHSTRPISAHPQKSSIDRQAGLKRAISTTQNSLSVQQKKERDLLTQISFYAGLINKKKNQISQQQQQQQHKRQQSSLVRLRNNWAGGAGRARRNMSIRIVNTTPTGPNEYASGRSSTNLHVNSKDGNRLNSGLSVHGSHNNKIFTAVGLQGKRQVQIERKPVPSILTRERVKRSVKALQMQKKKEYCLFYCKYGKCNLGSKCKFIHDPEKVAICRKFLKGACHDDQCLLSHSISADKMPTCAFFLRGNCSKSDCPFRHVKVNKNAQVCPDFLKGYCPAGAQCKLLHAFKSKKEDEKKETAAFLSDQKSDNNDTVNNNNINSPSDKNNNNNNNKDNFPTNFFNTKKLKSEMSEVIGHEKNHQSSRGDEQDSLEGLIPFFPGDDKDEDAFVNPSPFAEEKN